MPLVSLLAQIPGYLLIIAAIKFLDIYSQEFNTDLQDLHRFEACHRLEAGTRNLKATATFFKHHVKKPIDWQPFIHQATQLWYQQYTPLTNICLNQEHKHDVHFFQEGQTLNPYQPNWFFRPKIKR